MVRTKAAVLKSLRGTLDARGFVEVETPILQLTNGGAAARPFRTHLNALDQDDAAAHRARARPQAGDDRRGRPGLRDRPDLPQRGRSTPRTPPSSRCWRPTRPTATSDTMMELATRARARRGPGGRPHRRHRRATAARSTSSSAWRQAAILDLVSEAVGEESPWRPPVDELRGYADEHDVELQPRLGRRRDRRSSSTSSSSSTPWSSRRSSRTTRQSSSRSPSRTARSRAWTRPGTSSSTASSWRRRTPSSTTR